MEASTIYRPVFHMRKVRHRKVSYVACSLRVGASLGLVYSRAQ